jgi:hypothetical protein
VFSGRIFILRTQSQLGVADKKKMALVLNEPSAKSAFALGSGQ